MKDAYGTYATSSSAAASGARQASNASPAIGNGHDNPSERRRGPWTDERRNDAERHPPRRRIAQEDVEAGELLCRLAGEARRDTARVRRSR